jgi:hypothetical protein
VPRLVTNLDVLLGHIAVLLADRSPAPVGTRRAVTPVFTS